MTWQPIANNPYWEYDDAPSDPGGAQSALWSTGTAGIRVNPRGEEVYMNCRRVGTSYDSRPSEISKTFWDAVGGGSPYNDPLADIWTPADDTTNQLLWMDAADVSTITVDANNYVVSWNDKSPNSHVAAPENTATGDDDPISNVDQINNLNTISFDGGNSRGLKILSDISSTASDYIIIYVVDPAAIGNDIYVTDNTDIRLITTYHTTQGSDGIAFHPDAAGNWVVSGQSSPDAQINTFNLGNNSQSEVFLNGTSVAQSSWIQRAITTDFFIGSQRGSVNKVIQGKLGELIIYNRTETDLQQKLEGYLAHKWDLTDSLPAGHPYKSSAPTQSGFPYDFPLELE